MRAGGKEIERKVTSLKEKSNEPAAASEEKLTLPSHDNHASDANRQAQTLSDSVSIALQVEKELEQENYLSTQACPTEMELIFQQGDTCFTKILIEGDKSDKMPTENMCSPVVNHQWNNLGIKYEEDPRMTRLSLQLGQTDFLPKDTISSDDFIKEIDTVEDITLSPKGGDQKVHCESESSQQFDLGQRKSDASTENTPQKTKEYERIKEGVSQKLPSITPINICEEVIEEAHDHFGNVASFCCTRDQPDLEALILESCPNIEASEQDTKETSVEEPMDDLCKLPACKEDTMDKSIGYTSIWGKRRNNIIRKEDLSLLRLSQRDQGEAEDGKINTTEKSDVLRSDEYGRINPKESIMDDNKDANVATPPKSVNADFVQGLDGIDKFLEEVEPPDELDVGAAGSSMQDVLVGQGTQILKKRIAIFTSYVKKSFTATSFKKFLASRKNRDGKLMILKRDEVKVLWKHICASFRTINQRVEYLLDNLLYGEESENFDLNFSETEKDLESIRKKMMSKSNSF